VPWFGKETHLFELDTQTGTVSALLRSAHFHPTTDVFQSGWGMMTLESGKALVFSPGADREDTLKAYG